MTTHPLNWNLDDVVEQLGVAPVVDDEFFEWHLFRLEKNGLTLDLNVDQFHSVVDLLVLRSDDGAPIFSASFRVRGDIACETEHGHKRLVFRDCAALKKGVFYTQEDNEASERTLDKVLKHEESDALVTFDLQVDPTILVRFN